MTMSCMYVVLPNRAPIEIKGAATATSAPNKL